MTPDEESLVQTIVERVHARSERSAYDLARVAKRASSVHAIAVSVVFFVSLIGGAALLVDDLKKRPTSDDVKNLVAPVDDRVRAIETSQREISNDLTRMKRVQDLQLDQAQWQGEVLEHVARKKRGALPAKPEKLIEKETALLRGGDPWKK